MWGHAHAPRRALVLAGHFLRRECTARHRPGGSAGRSEPHGATDAGRGCAAAGTGSTRRSTNAGAAAGGPRPDTPSSATRTGAGTGAAQTDCGATRATQATTDATTPRTGEAAAHAPARRLTNQPRNDALGVGVKGHHVDVRSDRPPDVG